MEYSGIGRRRRCMSEKTYWFSAKTYGWGWGFPNRWQGWVVFLGYFALLLGGASLIDPKTSPAGYIAYAILLTVALVAICWWKGEPPRWRWGRPSA